MKMSLMYRHCQNLRVGLVGLQCHLVVVHICWYRASVGASAIAEDQLEVWAVPKTGVQEEVALLLLTVRLKVSNLC